MRLAGLALACALAAPAARAHDWYDSQCCQEHDCRPVPCETITAVPNGFDYKDPHDHAIYFFTRDKMKPSQDERCHVCLHGSVVHAPLCLYLPVSSWRRERPAGLRIQCEAGCTAWAQTLAEASAHAVAELMPQYSVHLLALHGPDHQIILLNPLEVVTVRKPRGEEGHFAKGVQCLIHTTDAKVVAVLEDCATVRALIDEQQGGH